MDLRRLLRHLRFGTDLPYRLYDRFVLLLRQLGPAHPLRRKADEARLPPFFIIGSGRSGNTLLRALLTGHPDLAIPPESYVLGPIVRDYRKLSFLSWKELVRVVLGRFQYHPQFGTWDTNLVEVYQRLASKVEEERSLAGILNAVYRVWAREHMPDAERWGDKTPTNVYHLPRLDVVFPDALYIHALRDGRDVVASYLEAGLYDSVNVACDRWIESVELVRSFVHRLPPDRYLEVRYERLVREPGQVIRQVCGHLEVDFEPKMMHHRDRVKELGDTGASHHAGLTRPIDDRSVGSWEDRLDDRQRRIVSEELSALLAELGYLS